MEKALNHEEAIQEIIVSLKEYFISDENRDLDGLKKQLKNSIIVSTCKQLNKVYPGSQAAISTYHLGNLSSNSVDANYKAKLALFESEVLEVFENLRLGHFLRFLEERCILEAA